MKNGRTLTETEQNELRAQHVALVNLEDEINTVTSELDRKGCYLEEAPVIILRRSKPRDPSDKPEWHAFRSVKIRCSGHATVGQD